MSQVTGNLTINDGSAVARTFVRQSVTPESSLFAMKISASAAGWKLLKVLYSAATQKRKTHRITVRTEMPVELLDAAGNPFVSDIGIAETTFVVPHAFTSANRADLVAYHLGALDNAQIKATVKDLDPLY